MRCLRNSFFAALLVSQVFCGITFRDKESAIVVTSRSELFASRDNLTIDHGTLELRAGSQLTGEPINLSVGRLVESGEEATVSGKIDLATEDGIILEDGGLLKVEGYQVARDVIVKGANNKIEGQPEFLVPPVLADASARLSIDIQNSLKTNIHLNDGHLLLDGDLKLADNAFFPFDGTLQLKGHRLELGSTYTFAFDANLTWLQAQDISLTGSVQLEGQWLFSDDATISGNGHILDVSGGGVLSIASGVTLALNDLIITGLGDGSLVFGDETSKLLLSNATLKLSEEITMSQGQVYVNSTSIIVLGDHNWYFDSTAKLTVDGASLWLDTLQTGTFPPLGQLHAPDAFYAPYPDYEANAMSNLNSGNFDLLNSGTVKLLHDGFVAYNTYAIRAVSPYIQNLLAGNLEGDYEIDQSVHLFVEDVIHVAGTNDAGSGAVLDGDGESLIFTPSPTAQVVIDDHRVFRISNIRLSNITANTFSIGRGAKLEIGENVILEFADDVTFDDGTIQIIGTSNTCTWRGIGGEYTVLLDVGTPQLPISLDLQSNTLELENMELKGLEYVTFSFGGTVKLAGNASIFVEIQTLLNFLISGLENVVYCERDDSYFKGTMRFDDNVLENEIHFAFHVSGGGRLEDQTVDFVDNFLTVSSTNGTSKVIFDDNVQIINDGANSFVLDKGAFLDGGYMMIKTNPIKQLSAAVQIGKDVVLESDQPNAIDLSSVEARVDLDWIKFFEGRDEARDGLVRGEYNVPSATVVYSNNVKLSSAFGAIDLQDGAKAESFGVHGTNILDLALVNGARLEQGSSTVTFKSTDSVAVRGKNNVVKVSGTMVYSGELALAADAELMFEFDPSTTNQVTFTSASSVTLGANASLSFVGFGTVVLADGAELDLGTAGSISLESSAKLTVETNGNAAIRGDGEVECTDGSTILLDDVSTLSFGVATSDDIALICRRGGGVHVSAVDATSGNARVLFAIGGHQISILESGFFYVGDNGIVEFCISGVNPQYGFVELFEVASNGFFLLDTGSKLSMCDNWNRNNVVRRCWWDGLSGWIRGKGTVEFTERSLGTKMISGQLYSAKDEIYFRDTSLSLWDIAKKLVQRDGTLQSVVYFTDVSSGLLSVLTGNEVIVNLPTTRQFTAELTTGGFETYDTVLRQKVVYGADGQVQ